MASAVQPRINKAIEDALRADTSLIELLRAIGGLTAIPTTLPLYWYMAPPSAALPYLVYGPQTRTEETLSLIHISEPTRRLMASRMPSSA